MDAQIVYLVAFPTTAREVGPSAPPPFTKSAPYFLELDIQFSELGQTDTALEGRRIAVRRQLIDGQVQSLEGRYQLLDILSETAQRQLQAIQRRLREWILREANYTGKLVEEYTIVCLSEFEGVPDEFIDAHRPALAALVGTEARAVSTTEAEQMLSSRARYGDGDITVVDWEGALILDHDGDFQSEIELLKIANYQLLRYRLLNAAIENNLETLRRELLQARRLSLGPSRILRDTLAQRMELLLNFEKIEQHLLLIGDWYSAQLYRLIVDEFYLDEWKAAVRDKLDQQESIADTIQNNFRWTWDQFLDVVQLVGWLVLLVGYFVLFFLENWPAGWLRWW